MCVRRTGPVGRSVPVLVVVCEAGESGHRTCVVVSDPLDHLPHFLPPLLLFQNPRLLIASPALPEQTHTAFQNLKQTKHFEMCKKHESKLFIIILQAADRRNSFYLGEFLKVLFQTPFCFLLISCFVVVFM